MNWVSYAIEKLQMGESATLTPHGGSMKGKVESGQTVEVAPCKIDDLIVGDIVLVKVKGNTYLHLIKAIKNNEHKYQFLIGNNKGGTNGWVNANAIYGKFTRIVETPSKTV